MKKNRIVGLDLVRCIAIISIVVFHFYINEKQIYNANIIFGNYDLGSFGVSLFLILSGAALVVSDKKNTTVMSFYLRRIKAIYPLFLLCTMIFFIINYLLNFKVFNNISILNWIPTILGFGGFLSYKYPSFNQVGEWYIGCIIILYAIYPLLKHMIEKIPKIAFAFLILLYIIINRFYCFQMPPIWNPLVRVIEFAFGIYYAKYFLPKQKNISNLKKIMIIIFALLAFFYFSYVKNNLYTMFNIALGGCAFFTFLINIADYIKNPKIKTLLSTGSKYSYPIFLVHHQINWLLAIRFINNPLTKNDYFYIFLIYLILTLFTSYIIKKLGDMLQNNLKI